MILNIVPTTNIIRLTREDGPESSFFEENEDCPITLAISRAVSSRGNTSYKDCIKDIENVLTGKKEESVKGEEIAFYGANKEVAILDNMVDIGVKPIIITTKELLEIFKALERVKQTRKPEEFTVKTAEIILNPPSVEDRNFNIKGWYNEMRDKYTQKFKNEGKL